MKKFVKISSYALGILTVFALAGILAIKLYFTPQRVKRLVLEYASSNFKREIDFKSAALNLSGFSLSGLKISEYPDFSKGEFVSAETISLHPSFRALLRRELKINSISASGLKMRVAEVKKNVYNFSDLIPAPTANKPGTAIPATKGNSSPALAISSLKVRDSGFSYANSAGDMTITLRNINLSASGISPAALFPLEADFIMDMASSYFTGSVPARFKGRLALGSFDIEKGKAEIDQAALALGGVKAEIKGSLSNLMEPDARLSISIKPFSTSDLKTVFSGLPPRLLLPGIIADSDFKLTPGNVNLRSVAFRAGPLTASLKGSVAWEPKISYDLTADIKAQTPELDTAQLAGKFKQIPRGFKLPLSAISARLLLKDATADIPSFSLDSAALAVTGRALVNFGGPALKAKGSIKAEVKDLSKTAAVAPALLSPYSLSGAARAEADYSYDGKLSVSGKAALNGLGAVFAERKLSALNGAIEFSKDTVTASKLEGKLDGAEFKASVKAYDLFKHPKAEFALNLAKLTLKNPPPAGAAEKKDTAGDKPAAEPFYFDISGKAETGAIEHPNFSCGRAAMKIDLVNISGDLKALSGDASFTAGPGTFSDLYALAGRYKAAKVALYPLLVLQKASKLAKGMNLPDFNNIAFEVIEGDYSFSKGLMKLNKSSLISPMAKASSSGTINLPDGKLNMKLDTTLKGASGVKMSAPLTLLVSGTMDSPSVKPDIKSILEQPVVKKNLDNAVKQGSKLLKGLFKK
ncbi:MAG TPA: hypothetical protein DCL44_08640 [Elusimicrobia bacterium]|nr:hypothetical protein [Elusimicrobiota bacterium]